MTWNLPQYLRMRWYCSILREASVINSDNKLITLAYIGRIIWIHQIIKSTTNTAENNL